MPIVAVQLKAAIKTRILNGYKAKFKAMAKDNPQAEKSWEDQADIISEIALDICEMLLTQAQVAPGIPVSTAGTPAAQTGATVAPGKLM